MFSIAFLSFSFLQIIYQPALYVLTALAFYHLARLRGLAYPWLAFIPFFNLYQMGSIGDTLKFNSSPFNRYLADVPLAYLLPILALVTGLLNVLPIIGGLLYFLCQVVLYLLQLLIYLFIFQQYCPQKKYLFTILSIIPLVGPILVLYTTRSYIR